MFHFQKLLFLLCFSHFLQAQKPSYVFFNVKNKISVADKVSTAAQYKIKCFIEKNENLADLTQKDTLFCHFKNKQKKPISTIELRQSISINAQISDNQLIGNLKNEAIGFAYTPSMKISQRKMIPLHSFKEKLLLDFKNGASQKFTTVYDSIAYAQEVTLELPTCVTEKPSAKNQGLVTVYYRAAREHLNKNQPSASSGGKALDWGHAFIGVKDLKTGKAYFLDGWPDSKFEGLVQHFEWNKTVDSIRTSDHHAITFNTDRKRLNLAVQLIENYKTACINYEMLDFNCADATTEILEKMGYYTLKEHSGTVFPNSFANKLMEKLNKIGVCYEFDERKVR